MFIASRASPASACQDRLVPPSPGLSEVSRPIRFPFYCLVNLWCVTPFPKKASFPLKTTKPLFPLTEFSHRSADASLVWLVSSDRRISPSFFLPGFPYLFLGQTQCPLTFPLLEGLAAMLSSPLNNTFFQRQEFSQAFFSFAAFLCRFPLFDVVFPLFPVFSMSGNNSNRFFQSWSCTSGKVFFVREFSPSVVLRDTLFFFLNNCVAESRTPLPFSREPLSNSLRFPHSFSPPCFEE